MQREYLIKKWLDNELTPQEHEAFKGLEDYHALVKLSNGVQQFKAPSYDSQEELNTLFHKIQPSKTTKRLWFKPLLKVAAVVAIVFSVYFYKSTLDTTIDTLASEKTSIELPDNSQVILNALTTLSYNKSDWKDSRSLNLDGEAYFKVEKGNRFTVNTSLGNVTVLGTKFNVKQRHNFFEVICYEGSVKVDALAQTQVLKPGDTFIILNNRIISTSQNSAVVPSWTGNTSTFKSLPLSYVLNEFERQYNVVFKTENIDTSAIFTGSFSHNNLERALKSITIPLGLKYNINNKIIVLASD